MPARSAPAARTAGATHRCIIFLQTHIRVRRVDRAGLCPPVNVMCERRARYDPSGRCFVGQQTLGVKQGPWGLDGSPSMNFDNAANAMWLTGASFDSNLTAGAKAVVKLYHEVKGTNGAGWPLAQCLHRAPPHAHQRTATKNTACVCTERLCPAHRFKSWLDHWPLLRAWWLQLIAQVNNDVWDWKDLHMGPDGKTCGQTSLPQGSALAGQPFVNSHYARQLQGWMVQRAASGQLYSAPDNTLEFRPRGITLPASAGAGAGAGAGERLPWFAGRAAGMLVVGNVRCLTHVHVRSPAPFG